MSARIFEDIFCLMFDVSCSDASFRSNPSVPDYILTYNKFNSISDDWKISDDLAKNKREKADVIIDKYKISLKTLKGQAYNTNDVINELKNLIIQ